MLDGLSRTGKPRFLDVKELLEKDFVDKANKKRGMPVPLAQMTWSVEAEMALGEVLDSAWTTGKTS